LNVSLEAFVLGAVHQSKGLRAKRDAAAGQRRERFDRVDEVFPFERSIDIETYDGHAEKLRDELTLA
jgi:hypothetical protein